MWRPHRIRLSSLVVLAALLTISPVLLAARSRVPRDKPLCRQTQLAVDTAEALAGRTPDQWAALEQRYAAGEVALDELGELRVHWAASDNVRFAASTWTLRLMNEELDASTAVGLSPALLAGDLQTVDEVLTAHARTAPFPHRELALLHAAALWGLGREGNGALVYTQALAGDSVFTYYDTTLEQWLRGRAAQVLAEDEAAVFLPEDLARAEALRQDLNNRGQFGRLVLAFLQGVPVPIGGYTPEGHLSPEVIDELFDTRRLDLHFCYENAGGESKLGAGIVTLDLDVDPLGRVTFCAVQPASELKDRDLWSCCCDSASTLRFPLPDGPGKATIRHRLELPLGK